MIARMNDESFEGGEGVQRDVEVRHIRRACGTSRPETVLWGVAPDEGPTFFAPDEFAELYAFDGSDFDADTPLMYNDARWHDPTTGQFLSTDPAGCEEDTLNNQ